MLDRLQSYKENGSNLDKLLHSLRDGGRAPMVINEKEWYFEALYVAIEIARAQKHPPPRDWEKYVFVFDPERVGFGEYGSERPLSKISTKWKDSLGLIQFKRDGMVFKYPEDLQMEDFTLVVSCIPRASVYSVDLVRHFLEESAICNRCVKVAEPFEVLEDGKAYCLECVNRLYPEHCNLCGKSHTGSPALRVKCGDYIYTCKSCRNMLYRWDKC